MNNEINYKANPLHGLGLKDLLTEIVNYYGFDILDAYLNINCFKTNPSIESSEKFLKKTDWAREKVEAFYLYQFKSLPRASDEQFQLSPRDRIIPEGQTPGEPAELSLEDAEVLRQKREEKAAEFNSSSRSVKSSAKRQSQHNAWRDDKKSPKSSSTPSNSDTDPWANWK